MGRSYLTMIESGEREGSVQIWQSLAAILDVPVSALMEETPVSDAHTASWRNDKAELCRLKQHVYAQAAERNISLALAWRLQLNLTQQQIAERMGVTRSWIGNLERKSNLQFSTSRRVARALAIPVEYLMP
jgi:transcriptional regulator with XRE-family HTH domain